MVHTLRKITEFEARCEEERLFRVMEFVRTILCFVDGEWAEAWGDREFFVDGVALERVNSNKFKLVDSEGNRRTLIRVQQMSEEPEGDQ